MKIVLATPVYPPEIGGPATYTKEIAARLRDDHALSIIAFADDADVIPGIPLVTVSKRMALPLRLALFTVKLIALARKADVIYVQNAVAAGLPAMIASMITRTPYVVKFVGDEAWERARQARRTEKRLEDFLAAPEGGVRTTIFMYIQKAVLRRAAFVTTPSAYLSAALVRAYGIRTDTAVVNYNAAEEADAPAFEAERRPHSIIATARLVEWKGIDGIIRATALLAEDFPDVTLTIAGEGPESERLQALAAECGVGSKVSFVGHVSRTETKRLRDQAEVYVLNSTYEGLPHTVLSSFAAGIPVVATDIPGTNEAVYHEKTGLLVLAGDDRALAHAITRLFKDRTLASQLVWEAKLLLKKKFSWEAHVTSLEGILAAAIRSTGAERAA
jgi:glycosyltransferase involved in cell wall biosynthesis